ncbi:Tad domain-containing protein [Sphingobium aquiterrae]|uniref:TadE/TadG family type IV pilus assembly protein n=1 Tax=Sphingobium aquiterrae TaxID=2038656 RepID=UPI003019B130
MAKKPSQTKGFLARLLASQAGNTMVIVAAAMFPLAGMIGGGLDLSRAYLTKTRLQQACDAGVLAGRKKMPAGGTVTTDITNEVKKYVEFNFPQGYQGTSSYAVVPTLAANDQIDLSLSTTIPTAVMKLFGKASIDLSVSCTARDDYSNIDIVLVLDNTGSMACKPERDGTNCSQWINGQIEDKKVKSGKTMTVNGRTVTYVQEETSSGTNVSRMQALRNALTSLQSTMATIETQFNTAAEGSRKRVRWSIVPFSQMVNAGLSIGPADTTLYNRHSDWFNSTGSYRKSSGTSAGSATSVSHGSTWMSSTWDGCVEETQTSNLITTSSSYSIPNNLPSGTNDLNFDTAPSSTQTRWTVADDSATGDAQYACPKFMRELDQMTATEFNDYFAFNNGFIANGGTFLDIGMLWAGRLLSRTGLWKDDNPQYFHSFPVARFVIFMTDGEMDTGQYGYAAYAQEKFWKRVTSDGAVATSNANHSKRLSMICTAIKNADARIYAISFGAGSTLNSDMQGCSSGAGYGYRAANADELNQAFRDIGDNIGSLRLSR